MAEVAGAVRAPCGLCWKARAASPWGQRVAKRSGAAARGRPVAEPPHGLPPGGFTARAVKPFVFIIIIAITTTIIIVNCVTRISQRAAPRPAPSPRGTAAPPPHRHVPTTSARRCFPFCRPADGPRGAARLHVVRAGGARGAPARSGASAGSPPPPPSFPPAAPRGPEGFQWPEQKGPFNRIQLPAARGRRGPALGGVPAAARWHHGHGPTPAGPPSAAPGAGRGCPCGCRPCGARDALVPLSGADGSPRRSPWGSHWGRWCSRSCPRQRDPSGAGATARLFSPVPPPFCSPCNPPCGARLSPRPGDPAGR